MRKLFSLMLALVLALGLACAEEAVPDLTGDWLLVYNVNGTEISYYVYLYENNTFELAGDDSEKNGKGTWAFDGSLLTLAAEEGDVISLVYDADAHQLQGEYGGIPARMELPIEPEIGEVPGGENVEEPAPGMLDGGWSAAQDPSVTDGVAALLEKATDGLVGVGYTPVAYLGSQVVAGTNHAILCRADAVVPDAVPYWAVVYIYEDLEGSVSLLDIVELALGV